MGRLCVILAVLMTLAMGRSRLINVLHVSRHGVRTPYPPTAGTVNDWSAYTPLQPPGAGAWGMDQSAFEDQHLTPHGKSLIKLLGAYFREKWDNASLWAGQDPCNNSSLGGVTVAFADNSKRDVQTGHAFLEGFGCPSVPVHVANGSLPEMEPVLSDGYKQPGCPLATEEQVTGLYGGSVAALTNAWSDPIGSIAEVLEMENAPNASKLCSEVNEVNEEDQEAGADNCSFFDLNYAWTGVYFQGMFTSPLYYAEYFAEAWMLQYVSNVTDFAWGKLTIQKLSALYSIHVKLMWFASNYWNARSYGSQQLAYITAALTRAAEYDADPASFDNSADDGKGQAHGDDDDDDVDPGLSLAQPQTKLLMLFCHDTNILYLRQLLGLSWIDYGWTGLAASTGCSLTFELHRGLPGGSEEDDAYYVKLVYTAASPQQQREATPLSLEEPPSEAHVIIPECGQIYCPLKDFQRIATRVLNESCVTEPLATTIDAIQASVSGDGGEGKSCPSSSWFEGVWAVVVVCVAVVLVLGAAGILCFYSFKEWRGNSNLPPFPTYLTGGHKDDEASSSSSNTLDASEHPWEPLTQNPEEARGGAAAGVGGAEEPSGKWR